MYSPIRHAGSILWKQKPIHLTVFLTRKCNSRCPFCFYLKATDKNPSDRQEITLGQIQRVAQSTGNLLWLAFSGGEIYLRKDLVEISKTFYDSNHPVIMLFPTNGLLPDVIGKMTKEILEYCINSTIVIKLSLDGVGRDHDEMRDTPGNFDKVMRTYEILEKYLKIYPNFELGFNTVFTSRNQDKTENIIHFVSTLKNVQSHTVSMVRGDLLESDHKQIDLNKYRQATEVLETRLKNKQSEIHRFRGAKLKAAQDILQRQLIHQTLEEREKSIRCHAGKLSLVLTESGDVYPCEILPDSLGNIHDHDYDLRKVVRTAQAKKVLKSISNKNKHCKTCTHECNYMMNILFNPILYPRLLKEYFQL